MLNIGIRKFVAGYIVVLSIAYYFLYALNLNLWLFYVKVLAGISFSVAIAVFVMTQLRRHVFKDIPPSSESSTLESSEEEVEEGPIAEPPISDSSILGDKALFAVELLLDRARVFETEVLRELTSIPTRTGVGFTATAAVIGGILTARDTLFWNFHMRWNLAPVFFGVEIGLIFISFLSFGIAFSPSNPKLGPDITDDLLIQQILSESKEQNKLELLRTLTNSYKENRRRILGASRFSTWGFSLLLLLALVLLFHVGYSGTIRSRAIDPHPLELWEEQPHEGQGDGQLQDVPNPALCGI